MPSSGCCQVSSFQLLKARAKIYDTDGTLEGDSESLLVVALVDVEALVGVEIGKRVAKVDRKSIFGRHPEESCGRSRWVE